MKFPVEIMSKRKIDAMNFIKNYSKVKEVGTQTTNGLGDMLLKMKIEELQKQVVELKFKLALAEDDLKLVLGWEIGV